MTFTDFLCGVARHGQGSPFLACVDHEAWPRRSSRLEDYEAFVRRFFGKAQLELIPDVRALWAQWAAEEGLAHGHLDLALATWRDYALHVRDCELSLSMPCPRAEELLAMAIAASRYQDLAINEPDPVPCETPTAKFCREVRQVIDQVFNPSALTPGIVPAVRRPPPQKPPRSKS